MPQSGDKTDIFTSCHNFFRKLISELKVLTVTSLTLHMFQQRINSMKVLFSPGKISICFLAGSKQQSQLKRTQRKCCETPNTTGGSAGTADQQLSCKEKHGQCLVQENKCSSINTVEAKTLRLTKIAEQQ